MNAEKLDQILEFISREENRKNNFDANDLQKELFPTLNEEQVEQLIFKIDDLKPEVSEILKGDYNTTVYCNGLTKPFLEDGGFTIIQNELIVEQQKQLERENIEFEKSKVDLKLAKRTLKEFPKTKMRAKVAYIIAIILAILQLTEWIVSLMFAD